MFSALCATLYIVGDQFAAFAANDGACTVSEFLALLVSGGLRRTEKLTVITGQGVDEAEAHALHDRLIEAGLGERIHFELPAGAIETRFAHKRRPENVLIAGLHQSSSEEYRAMLRLAAATRCWPITPPASTSRA